MPRFSLETAFTKDDLKLFYITGTSIVVAKPTSEAAKPDVAWLVYRPFANNQIEWEEQYGIYASTQRIVKGATLTKMSEVRVPAASGQLYDFGPAGYFGPPGSSGGTRNAFSTINQYVNERRYLTFGLTQDATIDGDTSTGNAISAAEVPIQSKATMTPFTTVYLWTQSSVKGNTVVTDVTSAMSAVKFGGSVTNVSLRYDGDTGTFVPTNAGEAEKAGITIEVHLPLLA